MHTHAVKYEEGSSVSFPRSERRHLDSVDLTPASSGWNWYDKDRSVSFGNRAGALQFSASLEPRDDPVHVLSYMSGSSLRIKPGPCAHGILFTSGLD